MLRRWSGTVASVGLLLKDYKLCIEATSLLSGLISYKSGLNPQPLPAAARYFEDRMGWTITNIWNLLTYDVEDTVYTVCKQVLDEEDIPKDMRTTRAAAIKEIGVIFQVSFSAGIPCKSH